MNDRIDLLEATLDCMDEAVVIVDGGLHVVFWNRAAAGLTGYEPRDVLARACPDLYGPPSPFQSGRPTAAALNHKSGHTIPAMLRIFPLELADGKPAGQALLFYPIEQLDAVPGGSSGPIDLDRTQSDIDDRLEAAHHQWRTAAIPFGLLRIAVDQAESLRTTHGQDACESMLRTVEHTLANQMKPAEFIGRWGASEFLVLAHERSADLLLEHARRLAGVARTADFRWWGDRVNLTVSIGAVFAAEGHTLNSLIDRTLDAMHSAIYAGGNQVVQARVL